MFRDGLRRNWRNPGAPHASGPCHEWLLRRSTATSRRPRRQTDCRLQHITTRGNNRRSIFEDDDDRERFYDLLATGIALHDVECHQDVLMGNHVHLLLDGEISAISTLLWFVSHRYALAYNARHDRVNHLFGRRFYSSDVPDGHAARAVCIYIALNPVRAGLCDHPLQWEHGSFRAAAGASTARPHLTADFVPDLFARSNSTLATAVEAAMARERGGRPALRDFLPIPDRLTPAHIRHARQVFGYTVDEIAAHYGRSARTLLRWLAL